jgi:hypothetical protein
MIYLTAIGLTTGGSGTVHIYTQYTEYRDGTYITLKKILNIQKILNVHKILNIQKNFKHTKNFKNTKNF